ncbi:Sulfatase [Hexamita inflata]|uniref:Sulfatase n=1 Tax=Hexamita inflata TaxID=28002 RepID=A0AA86QJP9_9EUKA|nr:Sulfatase [Hexamita inflata]
MQVFLTDCWLQFLLSSIVPLQFSFSSTISGISLVNSRLVLIPALFVLIFGIISLETVQVLIRSLCKSKYYKLMTKLCFVVWRFMTLTIGVIDIEMAREMMKRMSKFYVPVYLKHLKSEIQAPEDLIIGQSGKNEMSRQIANIAKHKTHWATLISWILANSIIYIIFLYKTVIQEFLKKKQHQNDDTEIEGKEKMNLEPIKSQKKNIPLLILQLFSVVFTITFFSITVSQNKFKQIVPSHWLLFQSSISPQMSQKEYLNSVKTFRTDYQLKNGSVWLDQRKIPIYPFMQATESIACVYNNNCKNKTSQYGSEFDRKHISEQAEEKPNVIFLIIESFSPQAFISNHITKSDLKIERGSMFKEFYLPNLSKLSTDSLNAVSLSSQGLPTVFGFLGLIAGEIPQTDYNIAQNSQNDVDDFPSFFRNQNYSTLYVAPSDPRFDCEQNWIWRGNMPSSKKFKQQQRWFDSFYNYFPTQIQADELKINLSTSKNWTPDRISSAQFIYYLNQSLNKTKQPHLGVWFSVDTHYPFRGYDDLQEYEQFKIGKGVNSGIKQRDKFDSYATLAKYTDHYIGKIIQFIEQNMSNTILVITGDHGAREVPLFQKGEQIDIYDNQSALYNDCKCGDSNFAVSALISYIGTNQKLIQKIQEVQGSVIKLPTDHQDLIKTLYNLINDSIPSSRLGRNLFDMINTTTELKHVSLRYTDILAEIAFEDRLIRFNPNALNGEMISIQPSCVEGQKQYQSNNTIKQDILKFTKYHKLVQYIQQRNQMFNYKFRDITCVQYNNCKFPVPQKPTKNYYLVQLMSVLFSIVIGSGLILTFVFSLLRAFK